MTREETTPEVEEALLGWAGTNGYEVAWGGVSVLDEARRRLLRLKEAGAFDPLYYDRRLSRFERAVPVGSVIVVSAPSAGNVVTFELPSGPFEARIPPTYAHNEAAKEELGRSLSAGPLRGGAAAVVSGPSKTAAAMLGLSRYGRNSITYTPASGSYHLLAGFAAAAVLTRHEPLVAVPDGSEAGKPARAPVGSRRPGSLPACQDCRACQSACPTGAISRGDHFLLRGERCLAYLTEHAGPWPDWVPPWAHNCLLGCLICQEVCPENRGRLRLAPVGLSFTLRETETLLSRGGRSGKVSAAVREKLGAVGLRGYEEVIGRNLAALLAAAESTRRPNDDGQE